ncbi:hypothetical protein ONZ51_g12531 [Trametes cubensis]|uniref:Uncharacterized protein n=1 Tax=Trametes cubensis TaxID=1111947 RepID=A0AAD7TGC8_9APHY|nr:hypothetical protein ONZ51_g12531 [Trametes cubensis]
MQTTTSTITLSPAVLEHQAQLKDQLENAELHEHFAIVLENVDPTSEVHSLKERIQDIRDGFRELSTKFGLLDSKLNRRKFKFLRHVGSKGLRTRWNLFQERFKTLLDQSQLNAMDASAVLKQNLHIFTDEHVQDAEKVGALKQEIENFMTIIGGKINHAGKLRDNLSKLSDDIRLFGREIGEKVECAQQHNEALFNELSEVYYKLQNLEVSLQSVTEELSDISLACFNCLSAGASSAAFFFVKLAPDAARTAVGSILDAVPQGISAARKRAEATRLRVQIQEARETISDLRKNHTAVNELTQLMQDTNAQVANLAVNIDALSNIWRYIRTDMVELRSLLGTVVGGGHITELFLHKLTITRTVYRKLVVALEEYSRETAL